MLLLLRHLKHRLFHLQQFRRYLLYALGEMVLVVIGILIALQIDNWNAGQQQDASLQSYLRSIARNVGSDLEAVREIRARREYAHDLAQRQAYTGRQIIYPPAEIAFAHHALTEAHALHAFNASTSAYEALKSSGNLNRLQGQDLETLLYDYYDTAARIEQDEASHNAFARQLWLQIVTQWPDGLIDWVIDDPGAAPAGLLAQMQPLIRRFLDTPTTGALMRHARATGPLLAQYERLELLGTALQQMVATGTLGFGAPARQILDQLHYLDEPGGYPQLITAGQIIWHSYAFLYADSIFQSNRGSGSPFDYKAFQRVDDHLHLTHAGGTDWAVISFAVAGSSERRPSRDFSSFDTLLLELKGDVGGETIYVNLKDRDDPDDGTQTNFKLTLTDQWQTYALDLAAFETADLTQLHIALAFLFLGEDPLAFSVRTARFVARD